MRNRICLIVVLACAGAWGQPDPREVKLLAHGFQFPEGPAVDRDGNIYLVNLQNGNINKVTPEGVVSVFVDTGAGNQSCLFDADGNLYICHNEPGRTGILKADRSGRLSVVTLESDGKPIRRTNDMAWGPGNRLYFTAPDSDTIHPAGEIHYIDTDGRTRSFAGGLVFANGITFNADKTWLYAGEERAARELSTIWRYKLNPDGSAARGGKEAFYRFTGRSYGVDGMKFDSEGNLWVAMYSESELWRFSPEGKKTGSIPIPGKNPTNLIFGGPGRRTAYVTVHHDRDGRLFSVRMPAPGAP
ncbi:MAG: SMP-30/gluconolactonase/LRE family protein [Acidobacteria bacterium]|nr:SMP-30/gluconolactonase/LRE family protein [Acidobacteriota bacterium]